MALSVNGLRDKELAGVLCRTVNRWLLEDYLPADPKRLKGIGLIPCQDPPAAVKELEWLIRHRTGGVIGAMLPVNVCGINSLRRLGPGAILDADVSASNDGVLVADERRR